MSYLNKYKVGSPLFCTLSEVRLQMTVLRNAIQHSYPPPTSIIDIKDYLGQYDEFRRYEKRSEASMFHLPETRIEPEVARPLLEKQTKIEFPESFVLCVPNGRVLGNGTVIVKNNAILSDTTTDFHRKQENHHLLSERKTPKPEQFNGRLAVITSPGSDNYFHWTLDSVPRLGLLEKLDREIDAYYVDDRSRFHLEWLSQLGIPSDKIISASPERHIKASELIVPSFAGLPGLPSPEGLDFIRRFMPNTPNRDGKRIYVSRSGARRRRILNEAELLPLLEKHGFEIVQPGKMSLSEQMETFASAQVVVSPHGAELTNLAYCSPGTEIIEIFSPYYLNPCFKQLAAIRGLEHTALVGKGGRRVLGNRQDVHYVWANIRIDIHGFEKELNRIEKTTTLPR